MLMLRPYPKPQERLNEYLLRLCYINGFFKITELMSVLGTNPIKQAQMGQWSPHHLKSLNEALTKALGRPCDDVIALHTRKDTDKWLYVYDRVLAELIVDFPRICVHCVSEEKTMDWRWSIGTVARCPKHRSPLIDTCPHCDKPLIWDANILEFCPKCKKPWKLGDIKALQPLTAFEKALWPTVDGTIDVSEKQLQALTYAMYMSARPFDVMIQRYGRIPFSQNHYQLVHNGLALLTNEDYRSKWAKACQRYWKNYPGYINPVHLFLESIEVLNTKENCQSFDFIERPEFIQKARVQYVKDKDQPIYHVDIFLLAKAINLSLSDATILFEAKTFPMVNKSFVGNHKMMKSKIFNIKDIIKKVKRFAKGPKASTSYIELNIESNLLPRYLCEYGDVVNAVLNKEIQGYFNDAFDLREVHVDKTMIFSWLSNHQEAQSRYAITIASSALALAIDEDAIKSLVYNGELRWGKHQRRGEFIEGDSFIGYVERNNLDET
jgi:hypothetical protein